jgi:hypothetical protein
VSIFDRAAARARQQELERRINNLELASVDAPPEVPLPDLDELRKFAAGGMVNLPKARAQAATVLAIVSTAARKAAGS